MNRTDMTTLEMISPEYNAPLDEALHKRILALRGTMIELEKKKTDDNPVPAGSKELLQEMLELEPDVCSFAAFIFYCEETAHACMLNEDPEQALKYAATALTCAQILGREEAQADLFGLLFKIAVFSNDFKMAMGFLEQKKEISPLEEDLNEAYESLEAVIENNILATPKFRIQGEELPITEAVMEVLERGPSEMAARLIRRAGGMPLAEARLEAEKLTPEQLNSMFGL